MKDYHFSKIEQAFLQISEQQSITTDIPYLIVENFPQLGFLTALRFIEWVQNNPNGVISLPTGKTPEFFIKWTQHIISNWDTDKIQAILKRYDIDGKNKPCFNNLHFVQIDEFYPINSKQHNSFYYYVNKFYIQGLGLDPAKAQLINCNEIPLPEGITYSEVFPEGKVDLSLRYREAKNAFEVIQQQSIFAIDNWCSEYEAKIRAKGGIGFFLGGIGPDGHIAFNTRGSDHYSTTRLTSINFETEAVAAGDLGGIEVARDHLVITIGLDTIVYNKDVTAIIIAAGEAKAPVVKDALENTPSNIYPASVLRGLKNSRFYITQGAACRLDDMIKQYYTGGEWNREKTERAIIDLCSRLYKYGHHITMDDLNHDEYCRLIPSVNEETVPQVQQTIEKKIHKGMAGESNQRFLHTGPHHDDIMLGLLPHIHRTLRNETNSAHFAVLTSGFTAVTNKFIIKALEDTLHFIDIGQVQMLKYADFFESGYLHKRDKDVYHYLIRVASCEPKELNRALSHRLVRSIVEIWQIKSKEQLIAQINEILTGLKSIYNGEKDVPEIQKLKGMVREYEEELVWAHYGIPTRQVQHLRLGFYTGDIFTEQPNFERDVKPVLDMLKKIDPTVISLALDPEGSGPDTHYKVLQTIAEAVRYWKKEKDLTGLRIWGYRNVWYQFHPAEANVIVPVSLNAMSNLDSAFTNSYLSQVNASFPSYRHDGKFNELAQKIWVDQLKTIQLLLGKHYFYQSEIPRLRACHGLLFYKEMSVDEFLINARELQRSMEGMEL